MLKLCIFQLLCSEVFIHFIYGRMKKVQLLSADHFFFMDFSKQVEIQIVSSPVYRGAAYSSASIAWSGSKLTSWFERSGNLDGDSVSPCPRMPNIGWMVGAVNAPFRKPTAVHLSSGDVMHHSRISSWAFYLQYHVLQF